MVAPRPAPEALAILARKPLWDPRLLWATLGLVAALLVGALVIALVDRWRRRTQPSALRPSDQLAQFRTLYERGELSAEEYDRVRGLLTERLVREMAGATGGEAARPPSPPDGSINQKLERMLKEMRIASRLPQPPSPETPPEQGFPPAP